MHPPTRDCASEPSQAVTMLPTVGRVRSPSTARAAAPARDSCRLPSQGRSIRTVRGRRIQGLVVGTLLAALAVPAWSIDTSAAEKLVNDNKCYKCHTVDRKKDGPAYRDVAAKFRNENDAVAKLIQHITSGEKVKFADGHEERHKKVKVDDPAELNNLAGWILSLEGGTKY